MYQVSLGELRVGMVLAEAIFTEDGKLLIKEGQSLNRAMIQKLVERKIPRISIADINSLQINPIDQMEEVLEESYHAAISKYSSPQIVGNKRDDIPKIVNRMKEVIAQIVKDETVLTYCLQMRMVKERNLFQKAVETSVFSGLLAGVCGCTFDQLTDIMLGGLLHDAGCLEMAFLIGKTDKTPQEELLWKEHPTYGYYFAIQNNLSRKVAEIIEYHEERVDGSGYPKQLKGEEIPIGARIVAICANITESTVYNGMKPYEALEIIYGTSGIYFDARLVNQFVKSIALYPMGALVRLSTGEIGIVTNIRKNHGARPIVNVHYNSFYKPLSQPKEIDLGKQRTIFIDEILD